MLDKKIEEKDIWVRWNRIEGITICGYKYIL